MAYNTFSPIVTDGLVFSVDAANYKSYNGGSEWVDLTSNYNVGTLTNGVSYDPSNGGSMFFDGVDDYVIFPYSSSTSQLGDMSINAWIKVVDYGGYRPIVSKTNGGIPSPFDFYLNPSAGKPSFLRGDGSSFFFYDGFLVPDFGIWQNLSVTMMGNTVSYYLNGNFIESGTINTPPVVTGDSGLSDMYIGYRSDAVTIMYGNISVIHIYSRALSSSDVLKNYNALKNRFI